MLCKSQILTVGKVSAESHVQSADISHTQRIIPLQRIIVAANTIQVNRPAVTPTVSYPAIDVERDVISNFHDSVLHARPVITKESVIPKVI